MDKKLPKKENIDSLISLLHKEADTKLADISLSNSSLVANTNVALDTNEKEANYRRHKRWFVGILVCFF